jgi:hypothetical protein
MFERYQDEVAIASVHRAKVKIHGQPEKQMHLGLHVKVSTNQFTAVNDSDFIATVYSNTTYSVVTHLNECSSGRAPKLIPYQRNLSLQLDSVLLVNMPGSSASYNRTTLFLAAKEDVEQQLQLNHGVGLGAVVDFVIFVFLLVCPVLRFWHRVRLIRFGLWQKYRHARIRQYFCMN